MKLPIIISDLDGTLTNTMDEVLEQIWDALGIALTPEDCIQYDVAEAFLPQLQHRLDLKALRDCLTTHVWENPMVYHNVRPYWLIHQAYQAFRNAGGTFIVITGRPDRRPVMRATADWLCAWGYTGADVYFSRTYGGKARVLREEIFGNPAIGEGDEIWIAEDDPEQALELAEALRFGKNTFDIDSTVYLVPRPWNQSGYGSLLKKRYLEQDIMERIDSLREQRVSEAEHV